MTYNIGDIYLSIAGRDKNCLYVLINIDKNYAVLSDGKIKKIENPKKKNLKHIQKIYNNNLEKITNHEIILAIKKAKQNIKL